jgi:phage terminase small subunit
MPAIERRYHRAGGRRVLLLKGEIMTPRQRFFVLEYLIDLDPKKAAIRAGYAPSGAAGRASVLLRRPEIVQAIRAAMDERARRTGITIERVLEEYARIIVALGWLDPASDAAWASPSSAAWHSDGGDAALALLAELSGRRNGEETREAVDRRTAIECLARLFGLNLVVPNAGRTHHA